MELSKIGFSQKSFRATVQFLFNGMATIVTLATVWKTRYSQTKARRPIKDQAEQNLDEFLQRSEKSCDASRILHYQCPST